MRAALRTWRARVGRHLGGLRSGLAAGLKRPVRTLLLISDDREVTSEQQFAPIWRHRGRLRRDLGLAVRWVPVETAIRMSPRVFQRFDVIGLKLSFRRPVEEARAIAARLRAASPRFVYFDGDDDSGILWPELLGLADLYVKKHVFRDSAAYAARFTGKSNLTTYVAETTGRSFADDVIPAAGGIDPVRLGPLHLGWNIALDDKIAALALHPPEADRPVDICSRAFVTPDNWLHALRGPAISALEAMGDRWTVAVPRGRVPQVDYDREMRSAKICVSPFGYGELCWRDFEAIMAGCLLVKPDMGHVRTAPDLFVAGETYVPVAWDYANLEAVCARWLADDAARIAVAARAQARLLDSLTPDWFVARMAEMLRTIDA